MTLDADALVSDLRRRHAVHTVILYGSWARGDATPESDVDVACFADVERTLRDARRWNGLLLDGFIHPSSSASGKPDDDLLKLAGGRALLDERGLASPLLATCEALDREPPAALAEDEARMRRVWHHKSLARARRGDAEADYRRHWVCYELMHDYFALRGLRYRGPKLALAELQRREPETFALFARAFAPGATLDALAALVECAVGPPPGSSAE